MPGTTGSYVLAEFVEPDADGPGQQGSEPAVPVSPIDIAAGRKGRRKRARIEASLAAAGAAAAAGGGGVAAPTTDAAAQALQPQMAAAAVQASAASGPTRIDLLIV